jgi:hypothetical protein
MCTLPEYVNYRQFHLNARTKYMYYMDTTVIEEGQYTVQYSDTGRNHTKFSKLIMHTFINATVVHINKLFAFFFGRKLEYLHTVQKVYMYDVKYKLKK